MGRLCLYRIPAVSGLNAELSLTSSDRERLGVVEFEQTLLARKERFAGFDLRANCPRWWDAPHGS